MKEELQEQISSKSVQLLTEQDTNQHLIHNIRGIILLILQYSYRNLCG